MVWALDLFRRMPACHLYHPYEGRESAVISGARSRLVSPPDTHSPCQWDPEKSPIVLRGDFQ
jgi:hypothetical protein